MIPQRLSTFGRGARLGFVRACGELEGQARRVWWADGHPCCLVGLMNGIELVTGSRRIFGGCRPPIFAAAAPARADGIVVVHQDPRGARVFTTSATRRVGERVFNKEDLVGAHLATDGFCVVLAARGGVSRFADWTLRSRMEWSLAPLQNALGETQAIVRGLHDLEDALLLETAAGWSRWSWGGRMLAAWPAPAACRVAAWHDVTPLVYMPARSAGGVPELVAWDLASGPSRSFGPAFERPCVARSPDLRWLVVDRVARDGHGLELWDMAEARLVERLETGRQVHAMAFAADGRSVAVATLRDLFVLCVA